MNSNNMSVKKKIKRSRSSQLEADLKLKYFFNSKANTNNFPNICNDNTEVIPIPKNKNEFIDQYQLYNLKDEDIKYQERLDKKYEYHTKKKKINCNINFNYEQDDYVVVPYDLFCDKNDTRKLVRTAIQWLAQYRGFYRKKTNKYIKENHKYLKNIRNELKNFNYLSSNISMDILNFIKFVKVNLQKEPYNYKDVNNNMVINIINDYLFSVAK